MTGRAPLRRLMLAALGFVLGAPAALRRSVRLRPHGSAYAVRGESERTPQRRDAGDPAGRGEESSGEEEGVAVEEVPYEEKWVPTTRRKFLTALLFASGGVGTAAVVGPAIGFLLSPLIREDREPWRPVGSIEDFAVGETVDVSFRDAEQLPWAGFAAQTSAWLRREDDERFVAFSVYCTHTGCPVRWLEQAGLFICPCHGGVFRRDGEVAAGPPTRPLARYPVRIADGRVEIQALPIPIAGTERVGAEDAAQDEAEGE
jgi:menaquinol-cytochrome c reductase iron-sulfur subunit